jgi:hypothetical protein
MRIEVSPGVRESLADATDLVGSTQVSVVSRLLDWFVSQPDVTQAAILGLYPGDIRKELPRMILEQMRAEKLSLRSPLGSTVLPTKQ